MDNKLEFYVSFEFNGKILHRVGEAELADAISAVLPDERGVETEDLRHALDMIKMDAVKKVRGR